MEPAELLLGAGRFVHMDGFTCSSEEIIARGYANNNRLAIVATTLNPKGAKGRISVPGYKFLEYASIGNVKVTQSGSKLSLDQNAISVLIFEK